MNNDELLKIAEHLIDRGDYDDPDCICMESDTNHPDCFYAQTPSVKYKVRLASTMLRLKRVVGQPIGEST